MDGRPISVRFQDRAALQRSLPAQKTVTMKKGEWHIQNWL